MKHKVRMTVIVTDENGKSHRRTMTIKGKDIYELHGIGRIEESYLLMLADIEIANGWREFPSYPKWQR